MTELYLFTEQDPIGFWYPTCIIHADMVFTSVGHLVLYKKLMFLGLVDAANLLSKMGDACITSLTSSCNNFIKGGDVSPQNLAAWAQVMSTESLQAFLLRGTQDVEFVRALLDTQDKLLALCSADTQVGIGQHCNLLDPCTWGHNKTGQVLMQVRSILKGTAPAETVSLPPISFLP